MAIKKILSNDQKVKDYQTKINSAFNSGDYTTVKQLETTRNSLIDKYKLNAQKTNYTYTPQYDTQINDLFGKLLNRDKFSYNAAEDPLYQQYKEQYTNQGKLAMQDTMGQAAALTGGYGSSYGQAVGQQQYDAYLQKLNEVVPELYQQAYSQYQDEGDELRNQYNMYLTKDAQDRENAQTYYSMMQDNYNKTQAAQDAAADQVDAILQAGGTPSSTLIKQSGLSTEYVNALKNYYTKLAAQKSSGSGSGSGSGSTEAKDYKVNSDGTTSIIPKRSLSFDQDEGIFRWNGNTYNSVKDLKDAWNKTSLSDEDEEVLRKKFKSQTGVDLSKYGY